MGQREQAGELRRTIGLSGSIALVVGGVIGAGIYVLVGAIGAMAGGAIWLAFTIAITISLVGVLPLIQLAGALPRAGAGYFFSSRLLSPFWGVMVSFWVILGGGASTAVVARTLAAYAQHYLPGSLPDSVVAIVLLLAFYGVYLFGMRLAMSLQVLMALQFVTALTVYGVAGAFHFGFELSVIAPGGSGGFLMAVLLAYSTCMGFQVIAEMGEEIHNARRTIPLALLIGGGIVAAIYILVGTVFVNSYGFDVEAISALEVPVTESAALFLPPWLVAFLSLGAITAALTSLNAAAIALPRELYAQARDGMAPRVLAWVSPRTHSPQHAITVYFLFVAALLMANQDIDFYGFAAAIGILVMSSVMCIAALRLPKVYPDRHFMAYITFPRPLLVVCTVITVLVAVGFAALVAWERPSVIALYGCWTVLVTVCYLLRVRRFSAEDWERFREVPGEDEEIVDS
jgi:APA family basic amino acid/polyamine antiporter